MADRESPFSVASRPRLLDLFCCEGGASTGYARAGFDVFGVDLNDDWSDWRKRPRTPPLRRYPFESIAADALDFLLSCDLSQFDAIHASPPCQAYSSITKVTGSRARAHPELIEPIRELLKGAGLPYVIENVERAPLREPVLLCGSMFDPPLDVQRHRLFEANWPLEPPAWPCRHLIWAPRFRSADYRGRREGRLTRVVPVYGGTRYPGDHEQRKRAMEIDWMSLDGLNESIPPRYSSTRSSSDANCVEGAARVAA